MSELTIFHGALEIADPQARAAYLDRACAGEAALRRRIEDLLQAHSMTAPFMSRPAAELLGAGQESAGGQAGTVIAGRYTLVERIGEGGMGEVWVAQQTEPVNRRVAVKLIKPGMDSNAVVARFEAERQALALMDHPNIAKVFDGGLTDRGRPFFVMELVNGLPLTRFCDEAKLTPRQRLELFVPVCQAVQHAHQKGIVHRDLKPTNVLVTLYDGRPVPKVIDFGVAKATGGKLTENTPTTQFGAVLGTLEYMAPEQAGFSAIDVDTRADIYSLGVILYEILSGLKPFDTARLNKAALDEVLRIIREEEPPRPSTRLSTDDALPSLAAVRQMEPKRLTALMRGELDWVVMKCLEKDRGRRYETASALGRDIQRYLEDEPVEARSPSRGYRLRKFVRRNRGPVLATALVVLALVGGFVGTTLGLFEANRQERLARSAAEEERNAKKAAIEATEAESQAHAQTQKRLGQLEKANDLLGSIFDNLDPREIAKMERPLQAILVEKLDKAVEQLDGQAIGDPLVVAEMQFRFGKSLLGLGEPGKAIVLLQKARATFQAQHGPTHPDTLNSANFLGLAYLDAGKFDLALPLLEETLKLREAALGPDHPATLASMHNLAMAHGKAGKFDLAVALSEESLQRTNAKLGPEHPDTIDNMNNLAAACQKTGNWQRAQQLFDETLKLQTAKRGPEHPDTLRTTNNLAVVYLDAGKLDQALPLLEKILKLRKVKLGPDHPDTLRNMNDLAMAFRAAGEFETALPLLEEALKLRRAKLGPEHPDTLHSMSNLGLTYRDAGKLDRALSILEEALKLQEALLGPDHPDSLTTMNNLALAHKDAGKLDLAVPLLEKTLRLRKAKLGPEHPETLTSMNNLGMAFQKAGMFDLALPLVEETLQLRKAKLGPEHPETLTSMNNLGVVYHGARQLDEALLLFEDAHKLMKAKLGPDHPKTLTAMNNLAAGYVDAGKLDLALPLFEEVLRLRKAKLGPDHPETLQSMNNLGVGYQAAGKFELAQPLHQEVLRLRKAKLGPDHPDTLHTMNNLALVYGKAGKLDLAVPLFEETLRLRKAKLGLDHPDTLKSMNNLAVAYHKDGKLDLELPLLEQTLRLMRTKLGSDHPSTLNVANDLAEDYLDAGKFELALPLFKDLLARARKTLPKDSPQLGAQLATFGLFLLQAKDCSEAETVLREALAIHEMKQPDHWLTFNTKSLLGGALLGQKKYAKAEPYCLDGYRGMKQREASIRPDGKRWLPEAADRLVKLYTAWDKPEQAAKWQAERAKHFELAPPPRLVKP